MSNISNFSNIGLLNVGYNLDIKNPHKPEAEKQYSSTELLDLLHQSFAKGDQLLEKLKKELA